MPRNDCPRWPKYAAGLTSDAAIARNSYFLSAALAGFTVGLEPLNAVHVRVWFYAIDLGLLEIEPQVDDTIYVNADSRVVGESTLKRTA